MKLGLPCCNVEEGSGAVYARRGSQLCVKREHTHSTTIETTHSRAGYTPNDYPTEKEWAARLLIETSAAAKCPSAAYQLAGSKKVQQALAAPGEVERFVGAAGGAALRQLFAGGARWRGVSCARRVWHCSAAGDRKHKPLEYPYA